MIHPALGIDYGDARIGIAATDTIGILAHPVETIPNKTEINVIKRIAELTKIRKIKTIVIGLPVRMDGTEGSSAKKIRHFSAQLASAIPDIPIAYVDETLTTVSAAEKLRAAGRKTKNHRQIIDQAAAVEILELWMSEQH